MNVQKVQLKSSSGTQRDLLGPLLDDLKGELVALGGGINSCVLLDSVSVVNVWAIGDSLKIGVASVLDRTALETSVDTGDLRLGAEEILVDTLRDVHDAGAKGCRPWHHDLVLRDIDFDAGELTKRLVVLLEPWHLGSLVRPGEDLDLEGVTLPPGDRQGLGCVHESWDLWVVHEDTVVDGGDQVDDLLAVL